MRWTVELKGLRSLQRLLRPAENLYAAPWRDGMEHLAQESGKLARGGAPVASGRLLLSIRTAVQRKPFPTWAAVRVPARNKRFPYPRLLAFSPKHHHKDWLLRAVQPVWSNAAGTLADIGNAIAKRWSKG